MTLVLLVLLVLASMIRRYVVWHNIHAYAGWSIGQTSPDPNAALDEGTLRLPLGIIHVSARLARRRINQSGRRAVTGAKRAGRLRGQASRPFSAGSGYSRAS